MPKQPVRSQEATCALAAIFDLLKMIAKTAAILQQLLDSDLGDIIREILQKDPGSLEDLLDNPATNKKSEK